MLYQTKFAGRELKIETNSFASQASGCAGLFWKTVVLGTATMGGKDIEADFYLLLLITKSDFMLQEELLDHDM